VTGCWFLDREAEWQPPRELVDFLKAGPAPVYVGFGSMYSSNPQEVTEMVLHALARVKQRGILQTGWGGLSNADLPDDVFAVDSIPHDWLFPQMASVVHHGGSGTTAAGLRAGMPTVIIPFFADQPFWGARVFELGAGPAPIPKKRLTLERLADAICAATSDEVIRGRASALGERIRAEDGVTQAVEVLYHHLHISSIDGD
jgi:sterol 3beta-glucosyltransferase